MKSETVYTRDIKWTLIYPRLSPDDKKEEDEVKRMNDFFAEIEAHIKAFSLSDKFPEGGKLSAECTHNIDDATTDCTFSVKRRGKLTRRIRVRLTWEKGYIKQTNIM